MAAASSISIARAGAPALRFAPSLPDLFFVLLLAARYAWPGSWQALLGDGDTGWHIRTGEYILAHGVPACDLFSFSRAGQPWYAWEWLSDVIFARMHNWFGLAGVVALGALLVTLPATLLFAWLLRRGTGAGIALITALAASSAASVHYLARPHLFSLVLLVAGLWLVDEDRRTRTSWLWTLVPMTGLWANLHGGFAAWLAILGWLVALSLAQRDWSALRRYGLLAGLSTVATLINPYGWQLHRHIWEFLWSPWIAEHVQEFQSPVIRAENMQIFAVLLLAGVVAAARTSRRSQWFEAGLVAIWGFAALHSARYVPLFAMLAAPLLASYLAQCWREWAERTGARSACHLLWQASLELGGQRRITPWMPILAALGLAAVLPTSGLADFPAGKFPVNAVNRNQRLLTSAPGARILTSDQWADYLIYKMYPRTTVFFDGRSDFYGPSIGDDYRALQLAERSSGAVMARYGFTAALLPLDWPLGQILEHDPAWRVAYRDLQAVLLVKTVGAAK
ncbi:MAG TPA: hypothetical protein VHW09_09230 [Bryobacteraceae bacterium]|jgi:hypothetical protein|nr:hypothetical protein [Bryobacteraceae bacterium]